jgi:RNA polymerase sigma factor (sigma-70 family)
VTPSDSELILRCLAKDENAAFGELVHRHQSAVRGFLRHLTRGDRAWADDLAQETFIRAYSGLRGYRGGSRFPTWLLGIAYNLFRNDRRRRREAPVSEGNCEIAAAPSEGPLLDLRQDMAAALSRLSPEEQLALKLSIDFALTHEEISVTTGWPLGTVKTHINRGRERLRELLSAWNPRT